MKILYGNNNIARKIACEMINFEYSKSVYIDCVLQLYPSEKLITVSYNKKSICGETQIVYDIYPSTGSIILPDYNFDIINDISTILDELDDEISRAKIKMEYLRPVRLGHITNIVRVINKKKRVLTRVDDRKFHRNAQFIWYYYTADRLSLDVSVSISEEITKKLCSIFYDKYNITASTGEFDRKNIAGYEQLCNFNDKISIYNTDFPFDNLFANSSVRSTRDMQICGIIEYIPEHHKLCSHCKCMIYGKYYTSIHDVYNSICRICVLICNDEYYIGSSPMNIMDATMYYLQYVTDNDIISILLDYLDHNEWYTNILDVTCDICVTKSYIGVNQLSKFITMILPRKPEWHGKKIFRLS